MFGVSGSSRALYTALATFRVVPALPAPGSSLVRLVVHGSGSLSRLDPLPSLAAGEYYSIIFTLDNCLKLGLALTFIRLPLPMSGEGMDWRPRVARTPSVLPGATCILPELFFMDRNCFLPTDSVFMADSGGYGCSSTGPLMTYRDSKVD